MLTAREKETYEYVCQFMAKNDIAPTISEIASGIGIRSKGVVHRYLQAIAEEGLITLVPNRRRNIVLNNYPARAANTDHWQMPLLGKIAAGQPIAAIPHQDHLDLAATLLADDRFALKISGDSMIDIGIFDGDYVICQVCSTARNGDIVVALIDQQEATLKRFKRLNQNCIQLTPENKSMQPLEYRSHRVTIQGVLRAVVRI